MALQFMRTYLCCGCSSDADDARAKDGGAYHPGLPDETTLLIPPSIEPSISYTDVAYLHQQRMQQRLGTIQNGKHKLANPLQPPQPAPPLGPHHLPQQQRQPQLRTRTQQLAPEPALALHAYKPKHPLSQPPLPQIPLALSPPPQHPQYQYCTPQHMGPLPLSLSRSPSPSRSHSHSHSHSPSRSRSNSSSLEDEDRSRERERRRAGEQPRPSPILNVRLVGYAPAGAVARGRARERGRRKGAAATEKVEKGSGVKSVTDEGEGAEGGDGQEGTEGSEGGEAKAVAVKKKKKAAFMFDEDVEGIAISWGD
ncbi:hypothetical protein D9611_014772 [Ephemerocybe angulata]|uniref:Uncharacterized protein n=1 Tax=Ephemerocybe angulata TaxID=980116 RepID=A0A8H5FHY7_9AGAR|nr:hypothetical protein D9611_014772 [Tulosesus angulatus]